MDEDLFEYPEGHVGRKSYVSVRGYSKSVPKYKTYRGRDGLNHVLPEYGGNGADYCDDAFFLLPDKAAYFSPLDMTVVGGRSAHREHMKRHGVVEAGDMKLGEFSGRERAPMPRVREDIYRAMAELS